MAMEEARHGGPEVSHSRRRRVVVASVASLLVAALLVAAPRSASAEPRLHEHSLGFGYHTVIFRTASADNYVLDGPSLVYDYFIGGRWGFALRGAAFFPVLGSMSGPTGEFSGSLLDMYDQRHYGFDLLVMAARRMILTPKLALEAGGGAHMQGFALNGATYSPVEDVSLGVGGLGKLDYALNEWLSASFQLAIGLDFFDLVDHKNPSRIVFPVSGSFAFAARY